jgi:23S rRNA (pseudouridine1915-N3)-methyltransferase
MKVSILSIAKPEKSLYSPLYKELEKMTSKFSAIEDIEIFNKKISVNFYIGGAYGFEDGFLKQCDQVISLGQLTMSHKIAKMVLLEQVFRGFAINNNHPYHK